MAINLIYVRVLEYFTGSEVTTVSIIPATYFVMGETLPFRVVPLLHDDFRVKPHKNRASLKTNGRTNQHVKWRSDWIVR